jgi:anti-sigma regulatory factor (Ser/Thr protein kinase)
VFRNGGEEVPRSAAVEPDVVGAFVIGALESDSHNLARLIQDAFDVSRSTAHSYLNALLDEGMIRRTGLGRYELVVREYVYLHDVAGMEEDVVWTEDVLSVLGDLPQNVLGVWRYGCTEIINNVVDHSGSDDVQIHVLRWPHHTEIRVHDSGVGIFRKISTSLGLQDDRHAVLELSKGKVTTDPEKHTGEGIFFSSRAFDQFQVLSGGVFFSHQYNHDEDWNIGKEQPAEEIIGTTVKMLMDNNSATNLGDVFDRYATDTEDYRFDKTVVPVKLLEYGDDALVSRSQAKRLMNRFDRFQTVVLDFEGVTSIGQAFADQVFRVFPSLHPEVELIPIRTNEQVSRMVNRALKHST